MKRPLPILAEVTADDVVVRLEIARIVGQLDGPGVYLLMRAGTVIYVGQARSIVRRLQDHWREGTKPFDDVAWIACNEADLNGCEWQLIQQFKPLHNKRFLDKPTERPSDVDGHRDRAAFVARLAWECYQDGYPKADLGRALARAVNRSRPYTTRYVEYMLRKVENVRSGKVVPRRKFEAFIFNAELPFVAYQE